MDGAKLQALVGILNDKVYEMCGENGRILQPFEYRDDGFAAALMFLDIPIITTEDGYEDDEILPEVKYEITKILQSLKAIKVKKLFKELENVNVTPSN